MTLKQMTDFVLGLATNHSHLHEVRGKLHIVGGAVGMYATYPPGSEGEAGRESCRTLGRRNLEVLSKLIGQPLPDFEKLAEQEEELT